MDIIKQLYIGLGYKNVQTYIQSGNVIFQTQDINTPDMEIRIAKQLLKTIGFEIPVLVIKFEEMMHIFQNNPFLHITTSNTATYYITFLSSIPDKINVEKLKSKTYDVDHFALIGRSIYIDCPTGYCNTKLTNIFFEKILSS